MIRKLIIKGSLILMKEVSHHSEKPIIQDKKVKKLHCEMIETLNPEIEIPSHHPLRIGKSYIIANSF